MSNINLKITKNCLDCKDKKGKSEFHSDKNRPDGLFPYCKECVSVRAKIYTQKNAAKLSLKRKAHYKKHKAVELAVNRDHIIPLKSFDLTGRNEFLRACHYSNLQPLWVEDHNKKALEESILRRSA